VKYSKKRREAILKKMLPPENKTIPEIAAEDGISTGTLYNWRKSARAEGRLVPDGDSTPEGWTSRDKFAAVLETAAMNEEQVAEYCRKRGLFPEQLSQWREACEEANDWDHLQGKKLRTARKGDRKRMKKLESELRRKEKALAETAALLVLSKKVAVLWGEDEDE
jgi:transposase-like protein